MANKKTKEILGVNINTLLLVAVVVIGLLIYNKFGVIQETQSIVIEKTITQALNSDDVTGTCSLISNKDTYCTGEYATVTLSNGKNEECAIYINKDNSGWVLWGMVNTGTAGSVKKYGQLLQNANYKVRAICTSVCVSNLLEVDVVTCLPSDEPEVECPYVEIASLDYNTPQNSYVDWLEVLPPDKYKFKWDVLINIPQHIQIIKNSASIQRFTNQDTGVYAFTSNGGEEWGIAIENPTTAPVATRISLEQQICPGDILNWNPSIFDSVHMTSGGGIQNT